MSPVIEIYVDGAASGNPGPAGIGGLIILDGKESHRFSESIGKATNNVAEYSALVKALESAREVSANSLVINSDSELMVKQLTGDYKLRSDNLRDLFVEAKRLMQAYDDVRVNHIPREKNKEADKLATQAIMPKTQKHKTGHIKAKPRITFISDFGHVDGWAGVCVTVIKDINPEADVIDIAHDIPGFDIRKGAFVLATTVQYVRAEAHLAVVDPGVGSFRRALILKARDGTILVGPDNGILLPAAERVGGVAYAVSITNTEYMLESRWATFNARDVFAPAAAYISAGVDIKKFGDEVDSHDLVAAPWSEARMSAQGIEAEIIDIDSFGTARLNIESTSIEKLGLVRGADIELSWSSRNARLSLERTFADVQPNKPIMLVDSSGFLSIAVNMGSAADQLGLYVSLRIHLLSA